MSATDSQRTFISSVLFLDIVGYSKRAVAEQIQLKEVFTKFLSRSIADVPVEDRIILDTGDGAAVSFIGDPEDALGVALGFREAMNASDTPADARAFSRLGINLGPIKFVTDINGQPQIVGDGINVAQRIMSFAPAGGILVSRSYFDAVSRISSDYVKLFHFEGSRTDKHVREHEVYRVGEHAEAITQVRGSLAARAMQRLQAIAAARKPRGPLISVSNVALAALATIVIALSLALVLRDRPDASAQSVAKSAPREPAGQKPRVGAAVPAPVATAPAQPEGSTLATAPDTAASNASTAAPLKPGQAGLRLDISAPAELFVNGKPFGNVTPGQSVALGPGNYNLELRSDDFLPHFELVRIREGAVVVVRHRFAKP